MDQAQYALGPAANGYIQNESGNWYEPNTGTYWWDQAAQTQQEQQTKQFYDQFAGSTPGVTQLPDDLAKQYITQLKATGGVQFNSPLGQLLAQYGYDPAHGTNYDPNDPLGRVFTTPPAAPKHTDSSLGWGNLVIPGTEWGTESGQGAISGMKGGLTIMAAPFAVAGGAALFGGAAGAGAGAAEGGTVGLDASTGLFAGESAASGAAGGSAVAGSGAIAGASGGNSAAGGGGTLDGGGYFDDFTGQWVDGTAPASTPYSTNPSTGDLGGNIDPATGLPQGTSPSLIEQAQALAKQYGITPSALKSLMSAGGKALPGILGAVGASQQANSLSALADKYMSLGAPSRARYEASFAPGFTMANEPGYKDALDLTTKATLHGLSVNGNPAQSPNAWDQTLTDINSKFAFPALQNFRNMNSNAGGISSLQTAAPAAATGAINAQGNVFNAIGAAGNDIFNAQPTLAETLAQYKKLLGATA